MIPEGTYKARAEEGALTPTSKGDPQVAVLLRLLDGGAGIEGQLITWYGSFSEKAVDRTLDSLRLLGWTGDDVSDLSGLTGTTAEVRAVIAQEPDQEGKVRTRVKWINAPGGLAVRARLEEGDAKAFAEKMRGYVMWHNQRQKGGQPRGGTAASKPASLPADDTDIPF